MIKDHRVDLPLRVVVYEKGSWQRVVSGFIQGYLKGVKCSSPLVLKNADQLLTDIQPFYCKPVKVFPLDIKDLFYSLDHGILLLRLKITS